MERPVIIAWTDKQIWAIDPERKARRHFIVTDLGKYPVLDMHASDSGIYHAVKDTKPREELYTLQGIKRWRTLYAPFVRVHESISGNPVFTINPKEPRWSEFGKSEPLDFNFVPGDGYLGYKMGEENGIIFPNFEANPLPCLDEVSFDGKDVYFSGKRIDRISQDIKNVYTMDAKQLGHLLRTNNKHRYKQVKGFFK